MTPGDGRPVLRAGGRRGEAPTVRPRGRRRRRGPSDDPSHGGVARGVHRARGRDPRPDSATARRNSSLASRRPSSTPRNAAKRCRASAGTGAGRPAAAPPTRSAASARRQRRIPGRQVPGREQQPVADVVVVVGARLGLARVAWPPPCVPPSAWTAVLRAPPRRAPGAATRCERSTSSQYRKYSSSKPPTSLATARAVTHQAGAAQPLLDVAGAAERRRRGSGCVRPSRSGPTRRTRPCRRGAGSAAPAACQRLGRARVTSSVERARSIVGVRVEQQESCAPPSGARDARVHPDAEADVAGRAATSSQPSAAASRRSPAAPRRRPVVDDDHARSAGDGSAARGSVEQADEP